VEGTLQQPPSKPSKSGDGSWQIDGSMSALWVRGHLKELFETQEEETTVSHRNSFRPLPRPPRSKTNIVVVIIIFDDHQEC